MKPKFKNKYEEQLFAAKTPKEFIALSYTLRTKIPGGRKAFICKHWLSCRKKYTIDDIKYTRNRHPHWKHLKMRGTKERNQIRCDMHNYYPGNDKQVWTPARIREFLAMNKKDERGKYQYRDHELAKHFEVSIPAIQGMRRKINMMPRIYSPSRLAVMSDREYREKIAQAEYLLAYQARRKRGA
jgi:hypothetical protein